MRKERLWVWLLNGSAAVAIAVLGVLHMYSGGMLSPKWAFSAGFVILGLGNCLAVPGKTRRERCFAASFLGGLVLSAVGDVTIDESFLTGAAAFGLGHVFFSVGCCAVLPVRRGDLAVIGCCFSAAAAYVLLQLAASGYCGLFLTYALLISLFLGKAAANLQRSPGIGTALTALGALLFFVSDLLLVTGSFTDLLPGTGRVSLGLYYLSAYLLASALLARRLLHR